MTSEFTDAIETNTHIVALTTRLKRKKTPFDSVRLSLKILEECRQFVNSLVVVLADPIDSADDNKERDVRLKIAALSVAESLQQVISVTQSHTTPSTM